MNTGALFDPHAPNHRAQPSAGSALPAYLRRHLEATGALDSNGFTRAVRLAPCHTCGADTLRALDGDTAAIEAIADAIEVDTIGEALAVAARRMRWWLHRAPNSKRDLEWQLVPRLTLNIATRRGPVFIEHRCNAPPPPAVDPYPLSGAEHSLDFPDTPPF